MAKPYAAEMAQLAATFDWAATVELTPLCQAVRTAAVSPLRVIGSGGSLTCAHALAGLHQRYTGHLAAVATPLEAVDEPLHAHTAAWLLSAGGRNADILAATKALIVREPRQIAALCGRDPSPLTALCRKHPFVDLLLYPPPAGKDGFLATNSLLAFVTLLTRAYAAEFGSSTDWDDTAASVKALLRKTPPVPDSWQTATAPLWTRSTVLVLHGPATRIGAIDLESKFTEAALGHVQIADYRNFAHGRHHWLAKRGTTSAVLAFLTAPDRRLAERTLALIPPEVPQVPIVLHGGPNAALLASLLATFWITAWAGRARRIDPGRPGVPEFGRKLYNLRPSRSRHPARPPGLTPRAAAAIARKAGVALDRLSDPHQITLWRDALHAFIHHLRRARFAGVVLDYDGTIVDTRHRTAPARPEMTSELVRLLTAGARIAIATGRGKSVRRDLQRSLPPVLWPLVLVGYYNGAQIAPLTDDRAPDGSPQLTVALQPLASMLSRQPELSAYVRQEHRGSQLTLSPTRPIALRRLYDLAQQAIFSTGLRDVTVMTSGHSVDIVAPGVSKLNVLQELRHAVGDEAVLSIGDRGRWPGNDHALLCRPFALAVDEISPDPTTCWHLGQPGQRGPAVTLEYLSALEARAGHLWFAAQSLQ